MANTFSNLVALAYAALDVVSRELVGFIPSVTLFPGAERVAKGQTIYSPVAPAATAPADITPAMTVTAAADQTIASKTLAIDNYKQSGFNWTGEEENSLNTGPGSKPIMQDQIEQILRAHVNAIELAVATAAKSGASRAYGTAGTTPFASDLSAPANVRKILDDNGTGADDRALVIDTTAGAKVRTLSQLTKANEANDSTMLRQGTMLDIHNFALRESAQVLTPAVGTGASYVLNGAHAIGATAIVVKTGTGTILAGDVLTINSQKYVVAAGGNIAAAGTLTINAPGLMASGADGDTVTVNAASTRNTAFRRSAIQLATRLPVAPSYGDQAIFVTVIKDSRSGIVFELRVYPGYRMFKVEIAIGYGVAIIKPEHIAFLLG